MDEESFLTQSQSVIILLRTTILKYWIVGGFIAQTSEWHTDLMSHFFVAVIQSSPVVVFIHR
jgi:hypothetical protein